MQKPVIREIEKEFMTKEVPKFMPGDTIRVSVKIVEGDRERLQDFEGVVISRHNSGLEENFTVRKISAGVGVERTFLFHSPAVDKIKLIRQGRVRRAKLYYLRERSGKAARIKELHY